MKKTIAALCASAVLLTTTACDEDFQWEDYEAESQTQHDQPIADEIESTGGSDESGDDLRVTADLVRVIDGDTVAVAADEEAGLPATNSAGTEHSVRLLGIDTTEMNFYSDEEPDCGAQEATNHLMWSIGDLEAAGSIEVTLVYDEASDRYDAYDRSLAYLEVGVIDINQKMVADGWAVAWYPGSAEEPSRYADYVKMQESAESLLSGGWGLCEDFEQIARG